MKLNGAVILIDCPQSRGQSMPWLASPFIGVIGVDSLMSRTGLGYEIGYAYNNFDNAVMYPLIVLVLAVAATVNTLFFLWERKMLARRRK